MWNCQRNTKLVHSLETDFVRVKTFETCDKPETNDTNLQVYTALGCVCCIVDCKILSIVSMIVLCPDPVPAATWSQIHRWNWWNSEVILVSSSSFKPFLWKHKWKLWFLKCLIQSSEVGPTVVFWNVLMIAPNYPNYSPVSDHRATTAK